MKDNTASPSAETSFVSAQPSVSRQQPTTAKGEAAPRPTPVLESDRINRRYSFDDNGGGYLGL